MFLSYWGGLGRTIGRDGFNWEEFVKKLHDSEEALRKLESKSLLDIDFESKELTEAIKEAYRNFRSIKYVGPTAASKILHLLNPELFVMWDDDIRKYYREEKKYRIDESETGYLEFLKAVKKELEEALEEEAERSKRSKKEIAEKICRTLPSKRLDPKHTRKTLAKLADEYNVIKSRKRKRTRGRRT